MSFIEPSTKDTINNNLLINIQNLSIKPPNKDYKNIVLITSVLYTLNYVGNKDISFNTDTTNTKISHPMSRSVFTHEERFEQTKKTIESIRKYIPNCAIFFMECSKLSDEHKTYLSENTDYFFNLEYTNLRAYMFTRSKALGEGTLTMYALNYLFQHNIKFSNLFKISGRYFLNENFCYDHWNNNKIVIKEFPPYMSVFTFFYKMSYKHSQKWFEYLINNYDNFYRCVGYETIYAHFVKKFPHEAILIELLGVEGYFSPDGSHLKV